MQLIDKNAVMNCLRSTPLYQMDKYLGVVDIIPAEFPPEEDSYLKYEDVSKAILSLEEAKVECESKDSYEIIEYLKKLVDDLREQIEKEKDYSTNLFEQLLDYQTKESNALSENVRSEAEKYKTIIRAIECAIGKEILDEYN